LNWAVNVKIRILLGASILLLSGQVGAAVITTYLDRASFETQLGSTVKDEYDLSLYGTGNNGLGSFTNSEMSAVLGETSYTATAHTDLNLVTPWLVGDGSYCAGCNGSFLLDFTGTSVGDTQGVYGVGFTMEFNYATTGSHYFWPVPDGVEGYHAFVTFGDDTTGDWELPLAAPIDFYSIHTSFWGITSEQKVKSIHIGLENGGISTFSTFRMDDLTIGSISPVPIPATVWLFGTGLIGLIGFSKRRKT
jgi:hypothetical protein